MSKDLRIVVGGFIGLFPAGAGVTWDYIQYPLGFAELGCDVYYIEDTRLWPIFQDDASEQVRADENVRHVSRIMEEFGMADRWAYRDEVSGECFGLPLNRVNEICRTADVFLNISCSTFLRDEYRMIPVRILLDSDPMFTQMQYESQLMFTEGESRMRQLVQAHNHHFTFGLNFGAADCRVPSCDIDWIPTVQPMCLAHWPVTEMLHRDQSAYTTIMNWTVAAPVVFEGETWGQKDEELERLMDLPQALPEISLSVAVGQTTGAPFPTDRAERCGWEVLDPQLCVPDWEAYRRFIQQSRGEFSVAKQTYVKARTGWFSCRSTCYLASGRPVVTQDTGWSRYLPHGEGLLPFEDRESAVDAIRTVERDPQRHARAARDIAEAHFDSQQVLAQMLEQVGV